MNDVTQVKSTIKSRTSMTMTPDLFLQVKQVAAEKKVSVSAFIEEAIKCYITALQA